MQRNEFTTDFADLPCAGQHNYRLAFGDARHSRFNMSVNIHRASLLSRISECNSIIYESFVLSMYLFTTGCSYTLILQLPVLDILREACYSLGSRLPIIIVFEGE